VAAVVALPVLAGAALRAGERARAGERERVRFDAGELRFIDGGVH
jgi:hypothetical protein